MEHTHKRCKVCIVCEKHGEFLQTPYNHGVLGFGCPACTASRGENKIRTFLITKSIEFTQNKTFPMCKHKKLLPFDFYLPEYNMIIEYDGKQHYEAVDHFGGEEYFKTIKMRDGIKNEYCRKENIRLIRIGYKEYDSIENILCSNLIAKLD